MAYVSAIKAGIPANLDTDKVRNEFNRRFNQAKEHSKVWRDESRSLYDLKAGHQWDPEVERDLEQKYAGAYPTTTFNLTNKYCSSVSGLQINNRQEIRYYPREPGDVGVDDFTTGAVKWCRDQADAEDEETDTFDDAFLTGMGWVEHCLNDEDPEAVYIAQERRDPIEMYWDPMCRKKNLVDRRYQIRIKAMTPEEFEEFFGDDPSSLEGATNLALEDTTPQVISIPHDYGTSKPSSAGPAPIYVADYQFCRTVKSWHVTAQFPEGPITQTYRDSEWKQARTALEQMGIPYEVDRIADRVYYRAWICGDEVRGKIRELPCGFTFEAVTGLRDRNTNTWYGMGRIVKDPQQWVNKFFASILYTLSVNAKGGLLAEEDAFEDQAKAEMSYADPASITFVASGALSQGKIQPKPPAPYPQGMDRLMEFTLGLLPLTSGMNPELMGLADRDQPGVLEAQRKQAAIAIIAWVFDAMRRYYKRSGRLMLSMIRVYVPDGQLIRISGEGGQKYLPLIKDRLVGKYDIIVDEAPTSVNMRERVWAILQTMIPMALQAGIPVPPDVLEYAPLPADLAAKWRKSLEPKPEAVQAQAKQQQLAEAEITAKVAKDQSAAQLNQARAAQVAAETNIAQEQAPIDQALKQMQTVHEAADAGVAQAGGA